DPGTRRDAVAALGHFGDRRAVGIAARLLSDPAVEVVRAAAGAIDWLGVGGVESSVAAAVMNPATPDDVAMMLLRSLTPSLKMNQKSPKVKKIVARLLSCGRRLEFDNGVFKVTLDVGQELLAGGFQLPEVTAAPAEAGARQTGGAHN
ncbi:MAG TPA: HEAT repeat domain-containing protein, partial [Myxococcota bacterium]|nr:HEAT repeat domain-containing protein [Myxococcota bacterium]